MKQDSINLTGHFLIAMPNLDDPYFAHTITFICTHDNDGAMGIIINQPTEITLQELCKEATVVATSASNAAQNILFGGPMQVDRGFILHPTEQAKTNDWNSSIDAGKHVVLTTSKDILEAIAIGEGPQQFAISLGYAGWSPGQLEEEILKNAWLSVEAPDSDTLNTILYKTPHNDIFDVTMKLLGIDPMMLSNAAGNA